MRWRSWGRSEKRRFFYDSRMALLPFGKTPLQKAVERFLRGADPEEAFEELDDYEITSRRDAEATVEALRHITRVAKAPADRYRTSPLHKLIGFIQDAEEPRVNEVLRKAAGAELLRIFDASFPPEPDDDDDLAFLLKNLVLLRAEGAADRVVRAALHPATSEMSLWSVTLSQIDGNHPFAEEIVTGLSNPLPSGFAGVGFLDLANELARAGRRGPHPFDTAEGLQRLEAYLTDPGSEYFSYAHSATAAIPFLRMPGRNHLLELASHHPDVHVRLESFWAAAKLGDANGIASLADAARDARHGTVALRLLDDLGHLDAAPRETQTEEHLALAEMADWLAYPTEFGAFPDALRVLDSRELFWPPTNDRRRLWLIEYTYEASSERPERDAGVGMVGSITFALFGESTDGMPVEDIYGLHCAWELEANQDPRAPDERTPAAGRKILGI